jgi:hypothetical protein
MKNYRVAATRLQRRSERELLLGKKWNSKELD